MHNICMWLVPCYYWADTICPCTKAQPHSRKVWSQAMHTENKERQ